MSKGLEMLKQIRPYADSSIDGELDIIEKELKEKEKQDFIYNILKEVIQFNVLQPEIKETDNGYSFMSGIALKMQRELENKERQLFRNWVLKECFPKELKALEILRECNLTIDEFNKKFDFISGKVPKDKVGLLKEVLL